MKNRIDPFARLDFPFNVRIDNIHDLRCSSGEKA